MQTLKDIFINLTSQDISKYSTILGYSFSNDCHQIITTKESAIIFSDNFYNDPTIYLNRLAEFELSLLDYLLNEGENCLLQLNDDYPLSASIFCKIITCTKEEERPDTMFVSLAEDIKLSLRPYIKNAIQECRNSGIRHFESIILGLLNIYGYLPKDELQKIFGGYFESLSPKESCALFDSVYNSSAILRLCTIHNNEETILHSPFCKEVNPIISERLKYPEITSFKHFTLDELLAAGSLPTPTIPNPHKHKLFAWLNSALHIDLWEAEEIAARLWKSRQHRELTTLEIINNTHLDAKSDSALFAIIEEYLSCSPLWSLCGYSSSEISKSSK